jgi:hypothetical protein
VYGPFQSELTFAGLIAGVFRPHRCDAVPIPTSADLFVPNTIHSKQ